MGGILAYFLSQQIAHFYAVPKPEPPSYFQTVMTYIGHISEWIANCEFFIDY